ncbi:MAG: TetR/AcrR family transcriptional regulator [Solirubrobacteraceae bacterium]|nr:TetR/AcrR family transcriptional regulator [Patulibacter sp.]
MHDPSTYAAAHPPKPAAPSTPRPDEPKLTIKGRATRDRIVEAAAALVFERGVAGTSIDDVRKAAGVSGSQMYHYFDDKQCLMRAVVRREADAVLEAQEPHLSHLDSLDRLRAWADGAIRKQQQVDCVGGCSFGSIACELADTDDEVARADIVDGFARWEGKIRDGLRAMKDRGDLSPAADPDQLALGLLAALQGGLMLAETTRTTAPLEAAMGAMLAHIASLAPAST